MPETSIPIEVVYGHQERQMLVSLDAPEGCSVQQAIDMSDLAREFPNDNLRLAPVAIWGKSASRGDQLRSGDRVEILRSLKINPRDRRRQLAEEGRYMGVSANEAGKPSRSD